MYSVVCRFDRLILSCQLLRQCDLLGNRRWVTTPQHETKQNNTDISCAVHSLQKNIVPSSQPHCYIHVSLFSNCTDVNCVFHRLPDTHKYIQIEKYVVLTIKAIKALRF